MQEIMTQGILERVDNSCRHGDHGMLCNAPSSVGPSLFRRLDKVGFLFSRDVLDPGHLVLRPRGVLYFPVFGEIDLFSEGLTDAHDHAADRLAPDHLGADDFAHIKGRNEAVDDDLS